MKNRGFNRNLAFLLEVRFPRFLKNSIEIEEHFQIFHLIQIIEVKEIDFQLNLKMNLVEIVLELDLQIVGKLILKQIQGKLEL